MPASIVTKGRQNYKEDFTVQEITIYVNPSENFTPAGLMKRYADNTPGVGFKRGYFGEAQLTIDGSTYDYHHWGITHENSRDCVKLFLRQVSA